MFGVVDNQERQKKSIMSKLIAVILDKLIMAFRFPLNFSLGYIQPHAVNNTLYILKIVNFLDRIQI